MLETISQTFSSKHLKLALFLSIIFLFRQIKKIMWTFYLSRSSCQNKHASSSLWVCSASHCGLQYMFSILCKFSYKTITRAKLHGKLAAHTYSRKHLQDKLIQPVCYKLNLHPTQLVGVQKEKKQQDVWSCSRVCFLCLQATFFRKRAEIWQ